MLRKVILSLCCVTVLVLSGCVQTDPLPETLYTSDLYATGDIYTDGHIVKYSATGGSGYWHEYNIGAFELYGGGGATPMISNLVTLGGYRLDDITETLYCQALVQDDWDGVTDGVLAISFEVNVDNTGGADTDTVEISVEAYHKLPGELMNTVDSLEGSTVVGKSDHNELFVQEVVIPNLGENEVRAFMLNLNTIFSEVDNIIINYVQFRYRTYYPAVEVN